MLKQSSCLSFQSSYTWLYTTVLEDVSDKQLYNLKTMDSPVASEEDEPGSFRKWGQDNLALKTMDL